MSPHLSGAIVNAAVWRLYCSLSNHTLSKGSVPHCTLYIAPDNLVPHGTAPYCTTVLYHITMKCTFNRTILFHFCTSLNSTSKFSVITSFTVDKNTELYLIKLGKFIFLLFLFVFVFVFYRTQVNPGSDRWVRMSVPPRPC